MIIELILTLVIVKLSITIEGWNGIKPFHSQRSDVEKVLGPPENACSSACFYGQPNERVFIGYTDEPCRGERSWRVPKDTVISITVYPSKTVKLSDLRLNTRRLTKTTDPELNGYYSYEDKETGVSYDFSEKNELISKEWFGTASDAKKFRCQ